MIPKMLMKEVLRHHLSGLVLSKSRWEQHQESITSDHPKKKGDIGEFLGGPAMKNPSSNAGDEGSIPSQGTEIPHASGQLSLLITTREKPSGCSERSQTPCATTKTQHCQK